MGQGHTSAQEHNDGWGPGLLMYQLGFCASVLCLTPTLLQKVQFIIPPSVVQDLPGAWLLVIRPGHTFREMLVALVVVGK